MGNVIEELDVRVIHKNTNQNIIMLVRHVLKKSVVEKI